jgi:hypothetical protein
MARPGRELGLGEDGREARFAGHETRKTIRGELVPETTVVTEGVEKHEARQITRWKQPEPDGSVVWETTAGTVGVEGREALATRCSAPRRPPGGCPGMKTGRTARGPADDAVGTDRGCGPETLAEKARAPGREGAETVALPRKAAEARGQTRVRR